MENATRDCDERSHVVSVIEEDDGRITVIDEERNVTATGDTTAQALRGLAEVLDRIDGKEQFERAGGDEKQFIKDAVREFFR